MTETFRENEPFSLIVGASFVKSRFDRFLSNTFPEVSRSILSQLIKDGLIRVNEEPRKAGYRLHEGDVIAGIVVSKAPDSELIPERLDLDILYEDKDLIVINKPAGLVVHPGAGNRNHTLANGLIYHYGRIREVGESGRPGIVHRLDKDTSGVLVAAKTGICHRLLSEMFKKRKVKKTYFALVKGRVKDETGRIVAPIGRHPVNRKKMTVCTEAKGRYAVTNWEVVRDYGNEASLVKLVIETGRTHQIRCHMAYIGHPVLGDVLYGGKSRYGECTRQMLHAKSLKFLHPVKEKEYEFKAKLPTDFIRCQDFYLTLAG